MSNPAAPDRSISVLHVDDEPDFAEMAATFVEREDGRFDIETATSADEGLDRLADSNFDCVVSDYDMPGQNGIEFLESLREDYPDLPFILFTGKGSEDVASDAISAGATDYLQKGGGTDQYELLANRIRNAVDQYRATQRAADLDRIRTLTSDINQALVRAESRTEIETRVCEIISNSDPYLFAWIGTVDLETDHVDPRTSAGIEDGYLDEVTITADDTPTGQGPAGTAIRERRVAVSQNLAKDPEFEPWREKALDRGYRAVAAVPLAYEDTIYGELTVYADRPHAFDEDERELLAELGSDIAHAIHSFDVQEQLRTERDRRQALFENAPGPVVAAEIREGGDDIVMTDVNEAFEDVFGYEAEEVVGKDPTELIIPEEELDQHKQIRERAVAGDTIVTEVERITVDGPRTFLLHIIPYGVMGSHADGLYAWFTDISPRQEREKAIEHLHNTVQTIMEAETKEEIAHNTVDTVRDILDLPGNAVYLHDESEDGLVPVAWTDWVEETVGNLPTFAPGEGIAWTVFETGKPQIYDDISNNPERYNPDTDVRSEILLPLGNHGVLIIGSVEPDAFDEMDVDLARILASHMTTALDRLTQEQDLRKYKTLVETVGDPMYILDAEGSIEMANSAMLDYLDADWEEVVGTSIQEFVAEGDYERETDLIRELLSDPDRDWATLEFTAVSSTGDRFPAELNLAVLTDDTGEFTGSVGVIRDISERKENEQQLKFERDRLESLFEAIPEPVLEVEFTDAGPLLRDANEAFEATFGYDATDAIGEYINDLIVPDDATTRAETEAIDQRADAGEQLIREVRRKTTDGLRDFLFRSAPIRQDGKTNRQFVLYIDITERRERERSVERLQRQTRELMHTKTKEETAQVAVETAHEVLGVQLSGCHLLGPDQHTLEPTAVVDTVRETLGDAPTYDRTADDNPASQIVWRVFESGDPLVIDDTREYDRLAEVTPARSAIIHPLDGHGVFIVSATEPNTFDDTDRALTEIIAMSLNAALERVEREDVLEQRNERLNRFASVVSHDLQNPLNVADGYLELAREEYDSDHLEKAANAIDRSLALIDDLLTLAREEGQVGEVEPVDLGETCERCWQNVETADATLVVESDRTIQADPGRVKQLLENLFRNAVEHGGEDVTVIIGDLDDKAGFYVADDGPGIPADERDQIFEAGYSTADEGTGFGLNIVAEIAEAHGWEIHVTESADGGARFEITGVEVTDE